MKSPGKMGRVFQICRSCNYCKQQYWISITCCHASIMNFSCDSGWHWISLSFSSYRKQNSSKKNYLDTWFSKATASIEKQFILAECKKKLFGSSVHAFFSLVMHPWILACVLGEREGGYYQKYPMKQQIRRHQSNCSIYFFLLFQ